MHIEHLSNQTQDIDAGAQAGVLPGHPELRPEGINPTLWNATHCGGPKYGVPTALKDFAAWYSAPCEVVVIEGFFGLDNRPIGAGDEPRAAD